MMKLLLLALATSVTALRLPTHSPRTVAAAAAAAVPMPVFAECAAESCGDVAVNYDIIASGALGVVATAGMPQWVTSNLITPSRVDLHVCALCARFSHRGHRL